MFETGDIVETKKGGHYRYLLLDNTDGNAYNVLVISSQVFTHGEIAHVLIDPEFWKKVA
jgi:hypothetical protein